MRPLLFGVGNVEVECCNNDLSICALAGQACVEHVSKLLCFSKWIQYWCLNSFLLNENLTRSIVCVCMAAVPTKAYWDTRYILFWYYYSCCVDCEQKKKSNWMESSDLDVKVMLYLHLSDFVFESIFSCRVARIPGGGGEREERSRHNLTKYKNERRNK